MSEQADVWERLVNQMEVASKIPGIAVEKLGHIEDLSMGPKKKTISIEIKREIIEKHEQGVRVVDLASMYGRSASTICTVLKQKDLVKGTTTAKGTTIISKRRTSLNEKMENLLMVWMTEKQLQGGTLTESIICEKARTIYDDLLKQISHTSTNEELENSFKASRGWFHNFRKRTGIHSVIHAAEVCIKTFLELIKAEEYIPQQELTTEELHDLLSQQHTVAQPEISFQEEPDMEAVISTRDIKEILGMWQKLKTCLKSTAPLPKRLPSLLALDTSAFGGRPASPSAHGAGDSSPDGSFVVGITHTYTREWDTFHIV
ncbi:tigger transposable element-derived protein 1-like [Anopheles bellator]|uniref:tigger transposable element-derived protein 1-like n=1 Tax=Anopheles bellator TaxID=139047 RepID=UPI002648B8EE|nr:tigger transposable element-derived protein 1-like [Anopheles bellator]